MFPEEIVTQIGTEHTAGIVACILHGSNANERHLALKMTAFNLSSAHVIKVEIYRVIKHPSAIHMGNDGEPAIARCNVGLECITDFRTIRFNPIENSVGFGFVEMITTDQAGIDAVFGEIVIIKIVIFQVNVRC